MNQAQIQSLCRLLLNTASGAILAYTASKSQPAKDLAGFLANFVTGPDALALAMSVVAWLWGHVTHSASTPTDAGKGGPLALVAALAAAGFMFTGCQSPALQSGGAYAPAQVVTNLSGTVTTNATSAPDLGLYFADQAYKLAYDTVDGVLKFEYDNRADLATKFPQLKPALDKIRPTVKDIDYRWAVARSIYKQNPTPDGLSQIQNILAEISRLVPVVNAQLTATINP